MKQIVVGLALAFLVGCSGSYTYKNTSTSGGQEAVIVVRTNNSLSRSRASYLLEGISSRMDNTCDIDFTQTAFQQNQRKSKFYIPITCTSSVVSRYDIRRAVRSVFSNYAVQINIRTH